MPLSSDSLQRRGFAGEGKQIAKVPRIGAYMDGAYILGHDSRVNGPPGPASQYQRQQLSSPQVNKMEHKRCVGSRRGGFEFSASSPASGPNSCLSYHPHGSSGDAYTAPSQVSVSDRVKCFLRTLSFCRPKAHWCDGKSWGGNIWGIKRRKGQVR